jgi:pimeloyl-ACP methyl ester carboxylesterase
VSALTLALLAACASNGASVASPSVLPPQTTTNVATTTTTSPPATAAEPSTTAAPSTTTTIPPPSTPAVSPPLSPFVGDPFFDPGDAPPGPPGTILRSRPLITKLKDARVWQVLYWSRTPDDRPVAVSATVMTPTSPGATPRPVLAYAHPTTGLGDQCAPSAQIASGTAVELILFPVLLQQGWTVVETDYQGLGTPGDHAYLIGQSEGRNVLDSIRAAEMLAGSGATPASKAVVWGHSQGGGASAFTAELRPTYAHNVDLVGAIAGAPAADLDPGNAMPANPQYDGFVAMALSGLRAGYPQLDVDAFLTPPGRIAVSEVSSLCVGRALTVMAGKTTLGLVTPSALGEPAWQAVIKANQGGNQHTDVPIFIYHGADDDLVSPASSAALLARYCAHGDVAARKVYPGKDHVTVVTAALIDIVANAKARFAGLPAPNDCA